MNFLVISEKKGLHLDLIVFFRQKLGEDQKKKVFTQVLIGFFCQKASKHTHKKKGHSDGFCGILQKASKYKRNSRTRFCNSQRQRGSINQPTDAETFGAGHFKTFGRPLVARGPRVGRPCHSVMYTPIQ